ncbi:MAG: ROK family protein, partial [Bdellovibrionales bacterium]|nr:ROK family protein [Bdellovibrionales bacterium]
MIGLDIGGTKIEAQLALIESTSGNQSIPIATTQQKLYLTVLAKMRRPTQRQQGYSAVMANISLLIKDLLEQQQLQLQELAGIGVGLPGTIDPASSTMLNGNSQIFIHQPFARDLQQHLGTDLPVHCTNDANLFTLAEVYGGVGPKYAQQFNRPISCHTAVGLILGTGVGG